MDTKPKNEVWEEWESFYPQLGRLLPNGNLLIPFAARLVSGELVDGKHEISTEHPNYAEWFAIVHTEARKQKKRDKQSK